ncbi:unnamed protein product [Brassica oleracea var. botrytis]
MVSVSELNTYVANSPPQVVEFRCTGKVGAIEINNGWCFISCCKCYKKLKREVASLTCPSCNDLNVVGVMRYRVEMSISDATGSTTFVVFDSELCK